MDSTKPGEAHYRWTVYLLPYIEEGPLFESYNMAAGFRGPSYQSLNDAFYKTPVKTYRCPSDTPGVFSGEAGINGWQRINVVACWSPDGTQVESGADYGDSPANVFNDPTKNPSTKKAVFNVNVKRGMQHVTDGLSNTVCFSEIVAGRDGTLDLRGAWSSELSTFYTAFWGRNTPNKDAIYNAIPQYCIDSTFTPCAATAPSFGTSMLFARSRHTGGVNGLVTDGSVRFFTNATDRQVWQDSHSISSGETTQLP